MKRKISLLSVFKQDERSEGPILWIIPVILLFILSVGYFCFFGSGIFFSQENNILFVYSSDYFWKYADKPGGALEYAGNFLTQFYYSPLAGSFIISILLILIFLILKQIARFLFAGKPFFLLFTLMPAAVLMLLQTRYDLHVHMILGFLIVLCWYYLSIRIDKTLWRIIFIMLFPLLYYLTGSFALLFAGIYIVYSLICLSGRLRFTIPLILISAAAVTYIIFTRIIFLQPAVRMVTYPLFLNETSRTTLFLSLFSGLLVLLPLLIKISGSAAFNRKIVHSMPFVTLLTVFALSVIILVKNYDREKASVMRFEKMVYAHDWDGVIRLNEQLQSSNIVVQYYYNLALSEKGQLCNRMFFSPQSFGSFSLTLTRDNEQSFRAMYFYYAIGLTAEAHHLAYELMVQHGYRPENLKMLIKTELITEHYTIAERYINVLKKTLHYRKWAEKYDKMLFHPAMIKSDPELGGKIRLMPKTDFFIQTDDFKNLNILLIDNPDNRIAFEYKMAKLLLEKDLMEAGSEVKKFRGLGYEHFPRHIEEAIVSLVNVTSEFPDMGGLSISKDTDQRFLQYFSALKSSKGNRKMAEKNLKKAEKNSFWFYLQFGLIKSDFFKSAPVDNSIY